MMGPIHKYILTFHDAMRNLARDLSDLAPFRSGFRITNVSISNFENLLETCSVGLRLEFSDYPPRPLLQAASDSTYEMTGIYVCPICSKSISASAADDDDDDDNDGDDVFFRCFALCGHTICEKCYLSMMDVNCNVVVCPLACAVEGQHQWTYRIKASDMDAARLEEPYPGTWRIRY